MNAGMIISIPVLVGRNPNWPKEWGRDWYFCEAAAAAADAAMLKVQSVPIEFPSTFLTPFKSQYPSLTEETCLS